MAAKVDAVLEALVNNAVRHGGTDATAILDAWAKYQGEPTAEERAKEDNDKDTAEQEAGKAANAKQVKDEEDAKQAKEGK
jgi:hypothetical protein